MTVSRIIDSEMEEFSRKYRNLAVSLVFVPFVVLLVKSMGYFTSNNNLISYIYLSILGYFVAKYLDKRVYKIISVLNLILAMIAYTIIIMPALIIPDILGVISYSIPYITIFIIAKFLKKENIN